MTPTPPETKNSPEKLFYAKKQEIETLYMKAGALCEALQAICNWTGTDWIGSHVRRAIEEVREAMNALHGVDRQ